MDKFIPITTAVAIWLFLVKECFEWVRRRKNKRNELRALKTLIYEEVKANSRPFRDFILFYEKLKDNQVIRLNIQTSFKDIFISYDDEDIDNKCFFISKHSSKIIEKYLLDISRVDPKLTNYIIDLRICIDHFNEFIVVGFEGFLDSNFKIDFVKSFLMKNKPVIEEYRKLCNSVMSYCNTKQSKPYMV
ncbi:hypothetical protein GWJ01_18560 [Proteus sp. G2618]|uniref:hypothetical protein n=1 Tax=Proteus TaxID=583 RepID=UPI00038431E4|nr:MULTISPECIES: hypothetical protein [Proteus]AGS60098.1 hypothetical protein BB2000_1613 [Proteus mirabilis BB2000]NBN73079.1 hypothetical protein [Proteus sp. G2618]